MKHQRYAIAAIFDTETTNLGTTAETAMAIPILYIDNDIRGVDLKQYQPDISDSIELYRTEDKYMERIREYVKWGKVTKQVPIICAYNLMFDLQSLMEGLSNEYEIEVNAQSSTNVYTLDLLNRDSGKTILRFWDTFHLDMRGLARMGDAAGLPKAVGDWDYSRIRHTHTPLSEEETFYASRDTQVIPMYLRFLLRTNDWMKQSDLGVKVLTKTSLVRQMARHDIGGIRITKENGKRITTEKMFVTICQQERPKVYNQYALRRACFRGGYTFTAAAFASTIQHNVVSVDVTSMHHTFINGRFVPDKFIIKDNDTIKNICWKILETTRSEVFNDYYRPFLFAIHARIKFANIRLRKGSVFERYGIALEPLSKFKPMADPIVDTAAYAGFDALIDDGWYDRFDGGVCAFGKLYSAETMTIHVNEVELWSLSRVYEWDSFEVLYGEATGSFCRPPDYVTLQSNVLYKAKDALKRIVNTYKEGQPYLGECPQILPDGYVKMLRDGTMVWDDLNAFYTGGVKAMFNGIYGTMAQDVYRADYKCEDGVISVDERSVMRRATWDLLQPEGCRVLYTYGMRIVAGSRLHMILAMEKVYEEFGDRARILGGDTDSMKISFDEGVTDNEIEQCLATFEVISKRAIDVTMERVRDKYPELASTLDGIGGFEVENSGNHYTTHIELWNKCRASFDSRGHSHVTCAGLSRPSDRYHISRLMDDLRESGYSDERILQTCIGYNVFVSNEVCHALEQNSPLPTDMFDGDVTDYLGTTAHVTAHQVKCLYPVGRWLGETLKQQNAQTVRYLKTHYNRDVNTNTRRLFFRGNEIEVTEAIDGEEQTVMVAQARGDW